VSLGSREVGNQLAPGRPRALSILYEIRKAQGKPDASAALIRRLVGFEPNNFWATNELTLLLLGRGNLVEAERHARNAVRIAPDLAQSHYLLGMVLTEANRPAVGEYHYQRALALSGARDPVLLANFALCLKNQGKMDAARALYEASLAAAPDALHTVMGLARLEEADRRLPEALSFLDRAASLAADNPNLLLLRAVVLGRMGETDAALAVLDKMAAAKAALGPAELVEKGPAARSHGPILRGLRRLRGRPSTPARDLRASLSGDPGTASRCPPEGLFHGKAPGNTAARHAPRRCRAAAVRTRVSALRHHAPGADLERPPAHRSRG
jgi:tetratricopeptide (TPR) repeat protein